MTPPRRSLDSQTMLQLAVDACGERRRRIASLLSDGPDLAPSFEGTCAQAALQGRLAAEPFTLPTHVQLQIEAAIDELDEPCPVDEELERLDGFARHVLGLLERRRDPHGRQRGGRRWLDPDACAPRTALPRGALRPAGIARPM